MTIHEKLLAVQSALKAPKGQTNAFGKYKYRSCEDILESVKPLLKEQGLVLTLSDSIENIGTRYYVKATATVVMDPAADTGPGPIFVTAYAREEDDKKGMDGAQITGAASSYARKYALNGLFCIDDTKDADATNDHGKAPQKAEKPAPKLKTDATPEQVKAITDLCAKLGKDTSKMWEHYGIPEGKPTVDQYRIIFAQLRAAEQKLSADLNSLATDKPQ